jgi:hypothetical protein
VKLQFYGQFIRLQNNYVYNYIEFCDIILLNLIRKQSLKLPLIQIPDSIQLIIPPIVLNVKFWRRWVAPIEIADFGIWCRVHLDIVVTLHSYTTQCLQTAT